MSIKENMLLAEFLGWKEQTDQTERWFGSFRTEEGILHRNTNKEPLLFHSDWNWLMLVVEKINTIEGGRFTFQIMSMDVEIHDYLKGGLYIDFFSGNTPDQLIKSVYEACVEFVKKYNNE